MAQKKRHRRQPLRFAAGLLAIACLAALGLLAFRLWLDVQMKPVLLAVCEARLKKELTEHVGEIWSGVAEEQGFTLDDVIERTCDSSGEIIALSADVERISALSSALSRSLTASFGDLERETISVPVGGVLNLPFSSGLGGELETEIADVSKVSTDIYSSVASVGINQTVYQLRLSVTVEAVLLFSGSMEQVTVTSDTLLGETVLVGEIPEQYVTITENSEDQSAADSLAAER